MRMLDVTKTVKSGTFFLVFGMFCALSQGVEMGGFWDRVKKIFTLTVARHAPSPSTVEI